MPTQKITKNIQATSLDGDLIPATPSPSHRIRSLRLPTVHPTVIQFGTAFANSPCLNLPGRTPALRCPNLNCGPHISASISIDYEITEGSNRGARLFLCQFESRRTGLAQSNQRFGFSRIQSPRPLSNVEAECSTSQSNNCRDHLQDESVTQVGQTSPAFTIVCMRASARAIG